MMRQITSVALVISFCATAHAQDEDVQAVELEPSNPSPSAEPAPTQPAEPAPAQPVEPAPAAAPPPPPMVEDTGEWTIKSSRLILGAERMMGFYTWTTTEEDANLPNTTTETEQSGTHLAFLASGTGNANPSTIPRLGFHFVLGPSLTLGGALGYITDSAETTETVTISGQPNAGAIVTDEGTLSTLLFGARFGYILSLGPVFSMWFRGGFNVYSTTTELGDVESSVNGTQISLDPGLLFTPVDHVGILVQGVVEYGASGNWEESGGGTKISGTYRLHTYGLSAGLATAF